MAKLCAKDDDVLLAPQSLNNTCYYKPLHHDSPNHHNSPDHHEDAGNIQIDQNALFQVAENLATNALRFADTHITVSLSIAKNTLHLTVSDDGPGSARSGFVPAHRRGSGRVHHSMPACNCGSAAGDCEDEYCGIDRSD